MTHSFVHAPSVPVHAAAFIIAHFLHETVDNAHTQARNAFAAQEPTMTDAEFGNHTARLNRMFDQCAGLCRLEELAKDAWEESSDDDSYQEYMEQVAFSFAGEHRQRPALHDPQRGIRSQPPAEDSSSFGVFKRDLRSILGEAGTTTAEPTKAEPTKQKVKTARTKRAKTKKAKAKKAKTKKAKVTKPKAKPKTTK